MSPSKKANKKASSKNTKSAQKNTKKTSVQSSRVVAIKRRSDQSSNGKPASTRPASRQTFQPEISPTSKTADFQNTALRVLVLLAVIGITIYIFSIRDRVEEFAAFGYPGIFLVALVANATILLPAPGLAIIYGMGAIFNPMGVGIAAAAGGAIGELSGYLAGYSGQAVIERTDIYERTKPWVDEYGGWAILVFSAIPNPFFDVAGIAAGIAKMPPKTFLFFVWVGQLIKMTTFAYAGRYSIEWLANFFK